MSENTQDRQDSSLVNPLAALQTEFVIPDGPETGETTATKDDTPGERLGFRIGDIGLLYPDAVGREVDEPPPVSPLPNAADWLSGIANVRGNMVPVVNLALAFGIEHDNSQSVYLLVTGRGEDAIGVLIDGLPAPQSLQPQDRLNGIPPHPEMLKGHIRSAYERAGTVWFDVNYQSFFENLANKVGVL
ncbi:MAG: chemotaxis protein CheW [Gammaproteobacteria bacterium]|nr:chemotaxis protein CheW [Gammaproteobacteria bacterium]